MSDKTAEPRFFIDAPVLMYAMDKEANIVIEKESSGLKASISKSTNPTESQKSLDQDGIRIFYPENLDLDATRQVKIELKKSFFGNKLKAEIIKRHSGGGFLGTRGCSG